MNKRVEVGCLVLIVGGLNAGRQGIVVQHDPEDSNGYIWAVDAGEAKGNRCSIMIVDNDPVWCQAQHIIRIDDYTEETETQEEECEV